MIDEDSRILLQSFIDNGMLSGTDVARMEETLKRNKIQSRK